MQDIHITKRGHYEKDGVAFSDGNQTHLLHSDKAFEAIVEIMPKGTVGVFYTLGESKLEFNYILKGKIELMDYGQPTLLEAGDSYSYHSLQRNIPFRVLENTEILGINTNPFFEEYQDTVVQLNAVLDQLQAVDGDTLDHCTRVKELSMGTAYFLRFDQTQLLNLFYASKFHDVGKAKIPADILLKPGKLTAAEFTTMKEHSRYTYEMIREYYGETIAAMAFEHHERLDGTGYPRGLRAEEICMGARIICAADAYDAMTVTRPYHIAMSREAALAELRRCQENQFDPCVVEALTRYLYSLE